jgi:hypothetical protein
VKPHKHCEVIKAWADGHEIQIKTLTAGWVTTLGPVWNENFEYRVKPKTIKYRVALYKGQVSDNYWAAALQDELQKDTLLHSIFVRWLTDWIEVEVDG